MFTFVLNFSKLLKIYFLQNGHVPFYYVTDLFDSQIFEVTDLPNRFESHGGGMDEHMKSDQFNVKPYFTSSNVSSSPAFSNVSILDMNHLSF